MADTVVSALDFLLENLKQLMSCNNPLILVEKNKIESLYDELGFLRNFLNDSGEESLYEHEEVKSLITKIGDLVYEAEDIVDSFVVSAFIVIQNDENMVLRLGDVMEEINSIKAQVMEIYNNKIYGIGVLQAGDSSHGDSSRAKTPTVQEDIIVGFDDEALAIADRLTGDQERLDIISIVGMGGLGKTTLARKLYNDPYIAYHFYIRAWVCVSQAYEKRDSLLGILNSVLPLTEQNQIHEMSDKKLCEKLYKCLKGNRYLVVIDDIWNIRAWDDLKRSFPNDNNGSRIMLTSRLSDVILQAKPDCRPCFLRFLTKEESWDLLKKKVFREDSCPQELTRIGKQIAEKCQGLPLSVVVIAGFLAKRDRTQESWNEIAESVSSHIVEDPTQCMNTLALSYNHLPRHLKTCFLYLGAFPEDYEIPARKLTLLWVAEGIIRQKEGKTLEDIAEDCLTDLIDRSIVFVAQRKSNGGIKACRIHDLLRDLCLRKAEEEKFFHQIYASEQVSSSADMQRRVFIHSDRFSYISLKPHAPHVRSLLCFKKSILRLLPRGDTSFIYQAFKLLRVLDLRSVGIYFFPNEIGRLVQLRYLALWPIGVIFPSSISFPSISNLWNLETLILKGPLSRIELPSNILKMIKLRHVYIEGGAYIPLVREPPNNDNPSVLCNLLTISTLCLSRSNEELMSRIPNIRKLGCKFTESGGCAFPELDYLVHLETVKLFSIRVTKLPVRFPSMYKFPSNLKELSLSRYCLPWTEMSTLGRLPNLQVLKLLDEAFNGPQWDTSDGEFLQLKFLKFQGLNIEQWNASSDHFPSLQRFVLAKCTKLKEIPYGLGDMSTLEMIEVDWSSPCAVLSAMQIQKQQQSMGNDWLKILIQPSLWQIEQKILRDMNDGFILPTLGLCEEECGNGCCIYISGYVL